MAMPRFLVRKRMEIDLSKTSPPPPEKNVWFNLICCLFFFKP